MRKIILIASLLINLLGLCSLFYIADKKGGLSRIVSSLNADAKPSYLHRTQLFDELSVKDKIVFLGDSLTENNELNELLGRDDVVNRGISGDTTANLLNRLDRITKDHPPKMFLMIGVNDFITKKPVSEVFDNYTKIVRRIKEKSPQTEIYIQETLRVNNDKSVNKVNNDDVDGLNKDLKSIDGVTVISMENLSENGKLKDEYSLDGIHLNGKGYLKWKENIVPYL